MLKDFCPSKKNKLGESWCACANMSLWLLPSNRSSCLCLCIICSWSWSSLKTQPCSNSEADISPKTIIFSRKVSLFLIWFCLLDGKQGGVSFPTCQASRDQGGLGLNYFSWLKILSFTWWNWTGSELENSQNSALLLAMFSLKPPHPQKEATQRRQYYTNWLWLSPAMEPW